MWCYNIIQMKFNARLEASLLILALPESIIKPTDRVTKWLITPVIWIEFTRTDIMGYSLQRALQWILLSEFEIFLNLYITMQWKRSVFSMMKNIIFFLSKSQLLLFFYLISFKLYSFEWEKKTSILHIVFLQKDYLRQCIP